MGRGSILDFIDGTHCRIYRRIESDRILGTVNIQIDCSRYAYRIDSQSRQLLSSPK